MMTLRPLSDVTAADWFVRADTSKWIKITLGPPGFEAYARVLFDRDRDAPGDAYVKVGREVRTVLARHTGTPEDCYFCLWDGWGGLDGGPQDTGLRWTVMPGRYSEADHAEARRLRAEAMLVDHAWFATKDVDPDWIGVGGARVLIDELLTDPRLDVVPTTYGADQPECR